jgi:hypothetical protein
MTALPQRPPRQPWPMKWVVLAILVFVVGYTLVNVYFRKPGRGFRPYEDMNNRATTARLLAAGWQKLPVDVRRPAEKPAVDDIPAAVSRAAIGLGADLEDKFAEKPKLLASIDRVVAPAAVEHGGAYNTYFTATLPTQKALVGELTLFRRGNELVLIPSTEPLPGRELMSRWDDSTYHVSISTANLPAGRYQMRIVAKGPAAAWSFTVK